MTVGRSLVIGVIEDNADPGDVLVHGFRAEAQPTGLASGSQDLSVLDAGRKTALELSFRLAPSVWEFLAKLVERGDVALIKIVDPHIATTREIEEADGRSDLLDRINRPGFGIFVRLDAG